MKNLLLLFFFGMSLMLTASCTKNSNEDSPPGTAIIQNVDYEARIADLVQDAAIHYADGPNEQLLIFSEEEFRSICMLEDSVLNIWTDEQLRKCMPIGERNTMSYKDRLDYLRSFLSENRAYNEGSTIETYQLRSGPARFDANADIVAQVIAASGEIVGVNSSLNMWRPTFPYDNGQVTSFDITRALSGVAQVSYLDVAVEYLPESVTFEFEVSGGNWFIGAAIVTTSPAGTTDTTYYGSNTANGPLIWNPTLSSPADDDVIQGPMPGGVVSISANGLVPPLPIE